MNLDPQHQLEHDLEALIDKAGLQPVLDALETVCYEKGEHLRSNWQDEPAAKVWDRVGRQVDRINIT